MDELLLSVCGIPSQVGTFYNFIKNAKKSDALTKKQCLGCSAGENE